jgi:hypothetical protein
MALGFGKEEMGALANVALATGADLNTMGSDIIQLSYAMSESTGVSRKKIAKDMAQIMGDFKNFGAIGAEQAAIISGKMRSLGLDIKALGKMIDKNMNFDSAAESAAQLGQAFGMAIDPMQMMTKAANDPIGMLEDMRKSMFAAGKSAENMNAAEMRLLSTQTGLSAEEAKLMFSRKNRGKSAKQLKKDSKSQLTDQQKQTKATKEMAKEMSKLVEVLTTGGIFENLTEGFSNAMKLGGNLGEFEDLNAVFYRIGAQFGKVMNMLIDSGFLKSITEALAKMEPLMQGLMDNDFFQKLIDGDYAGAMKVFGEQFEEVFGATFMNALDSAAAFLVENAATIVSKFADLLEVIIDEISSDGPKSKLAEAFEKLFSAWVKLWDVIQPHVEALLNTLFNFFVEYAKANPGKVIAIWAVLSGPSAMALVAAAGIGVAAGYVTNAINFIKGAGPMMWKAIKGVFTLPVKVMDSFSSQGPIGRFFDEILFKLELIKDRIKSAFTFKTPTWMSKIGENFTKVGKKLEPIKNFFTSLGTKIGNMKDLFVKAGTKVGEFGSKFGFLKKLTNVFKFFKFLSSSVMSVLYVIFYAITDIFKSVEQGGSWISGLFAGIAHGANEFIFSFYDFANWITSFFGMNMDDTWLGQWVATVREAWEALDFATIGADLLFGWNEMMAGLVAAWDSVVDGIVAAGKAIWAAIKWPFVKSYEWIMRLWDPMFGRSMSGFAKSILKGITSAKDAIWGVLTWPYVEGWKLITTTFSKENMQAIWDGIKSVIETAQDVVYSLTIGPFIQAYDYVADLLGFDSFSEIMDDITSGISSGADMIYDAFTGVFDPAIEWFKDKFGFLMPGSASEFMDNITAGITNGAGMLLDEFKSMVNAPIDWLKDKGSALVEGGANLVAGITEGITSVIDDPVGAISSVGDAISDGWDTAMSIFSPSQRMAVGGEQVTAGIGEGIQQNEGSALDSIMGLGDSLMGAAGKFMPDLGGIFGGIGTTLSESLGGEMSVITGGLSSFGLGSFKEMFKIFTPEGGLFGDVTPELLESMTAQADGILANANQLITVLETIKETVEGIPEIKIDKTIDSIAKGTQVVKDFSKIKDKPLALTVTLNIKMNAEQIATELLNTDAMKVVAKV